MREVERLKRFRVKSVGVNVRERIVPSMYPPLRESEEGRPKLRDSYFRHPDNYMNFGKQS